MSDTKLLILLAGAVVAALILRHVTRNRVIMYSGLDRLTRVATATAVGGVALVLVGFLFTRLAALNAFTPVPGYLSAIVGLVAVATGLLVLLAALVLTLPAPPGARAPSSPSTPATDFRLAKASLTLLKDISRIFLGVVFRVLARVVRGLGDERGQLGDPLDPYGTNLNLDTGAYDQELGARRSQFPFGGPRS